MDGCFSHIPGPVADLHAPALEAIAERIGHGVAKLTQLVFQFPLHLLALGLLHPIVFTIVHQNLLTLLPDDTGR